MPGEAPPRTVTAQSLVQDAMRVHTLGYSCDQADGDPRPWGADFLAEKVDNK